MNYSFDTNSVIRIWPHKHKLEGFFAIKLKKTGSIKSKDKDKKQVYIETKGSSDLLVKMILENISENWGIPFKVWNKYQFIVTKTRIWMVNRNIKKCLSHSFVSAGLLLAESRLLFWKLTNGSIQLLAEHICKRKIEIGDEQLKVLFARGTITCNEYSNGYYALCRRGIPVASVYINKNEMRIRLPHKFRLVFLDKK